MYKEALRSAWVEVNLSNVDYNIKQIKEKIGEHVDIIAVIKADAYGHGAIKIIEVLRENGVKSFAVATLQECIVLREAGVMEEIIMLGLTPDMYADIIVKYNITPVVNSFDNAKAISDEAEIHGMEVRGFIAVDTGMGRIGYLADDESAIEEIKKIHQLPNFDIKGVFSHLATSDEKDKTFVKEQEEKFREFVAKVEASDIKLSVKTLGNSGAIMEIPTCHFDAVRPGIIMYGGYPSKEVEQSILSLKPAMSVKANIVHLKKVPVGFSCGYGRHFVAKRESLIATLSLGYADGYPRAYSSKGEVIVNGRKAPIAGNICMDQFMIDVTDVPDVKLGDEVIIMGSDGNNTISADDIAEATGTISYEILCAFGRRLPKVYVK